MLKKANQWIKGIGVLLLAGSAVAQEVQPIQTAPSRLAFIKLHVLMKESQSEVEKKLNDASQELVQLSQDILALERQHIESASEETRVKIQDLQNAFAHKSIEFSSQNVSDIDTIQQEMTEKIKRIEAAVAEIAHNRFDAVVVTNQLMFTKENVELVDITSEVCNQLEVNKQVSK
jgi:hypothetical protein